MTKNVTFKITELSIFCEGSGYVVAVVRSNTSLVHDSCRVAHTRRAG